MLPRQQFGGPYGPVKVEAQAVNRAAAQLQPAREGPMGQIASFLYHVAVVALLGVTVGLLATISSRPEAHQPKGVCQPSAMFRLGQASVNDLAMTLPAESGEQLQEQASALLPAELQEYANMVALELSSMPGVAYSTTSFAERWKDAFDDGFQTDVPGHDKWSNTPQECIALKNANECSTASHAWQSFVMGTVVRYGALRYALEMHDASDPRRWSHPTEEEKEVINKGFEAMRSTVATMHSSPCVWQAA